MDTENLRGEGLRKDIVDRGSVFPNIFWYDLHSAGLTTGKWHGLCGLRLLQTLRCYGELLAGDVGALLHLAFGYSKFVVTECIEAFVAFGLLALKMDERPNNTELRLEQASTDQHLKLYRVWIRLTPKALLYLDFIWTRFDILYFLALDTPLDQTMVDDDRLVRIHRDVEDPRKVFSDYQEAAIPTVTVLMRHIVDFHRREMTALETNLNRAPTTERIVPNAKHYSEHLALPRIWRGNYSEFVERAIDTTNPRTRERAENLRLNIRGAFGIAKRR
jgi:hypothetical protein